MAFSTQLNGFDFTSLDLLQRILLTSDGTVTDIIGSAFLEPIGLVKLSVQVRRAPLAIDLLDLKAGEDIMDRKILLVGKMSDKRYVYAESLIALSRLTVGFRRDLCSSNLPIGQLWSQHRVETWKELLDISYDSPSDVITHFGPEQAGGLLKRAYKLISNARPIALITEYFPATYNLDLALRPVGYARDPGVSAPPQSAPNDQ